MRKGRLEAFSDGVLAIILTIMVLELKAPHGAAWVDLVPTLKVFGAYVLSFVFVAIYWVNHHHMFQTVDRISGPMLWANVHLLFWLSLVPFGTAWINDVGFQSLPVFAYGLVLVLCGIAYDILQRTIIRAQGPDSRLKSAVGKDVKGRASIGLYLIALVTAWKAPSLSVALFVVVALMWLVPDRRIERLAHHEAPESS